MLGKSQTFPAISTDIGKQLMRASCLCGFERSLIKQRADTRTARTRIDDDPQPNASWGHMSRSADTRIANALIGLVNSHSKQHALLRRPFTSPALHQRRCNRLSVHLIHKRRYPICITQRIEWPEMYRT